MDNNILKNVSTLPGFAFKQEDIYKISKEKYNNENNIVISDDIYIKLLKNIMIDKDKKKYSRKIPKSNPKSNPKRHTRKK